VQRQEASKRVTSSQADVAVGEVVLAGLRLKIDPLGALIYEDERMMIVADLHLEKGSSYAKRGVMLPPYDTGTTLARLAVLIAR
jgi:metallophosphoesterase superfamily enzyme